MATSKTSNKSSRKRYKFFSENADEFDSEIKNNQTTIAIIVVTDTSLQTSIFTYPSSSKNISQNKHQPHPFSEIAKRDPNYTRRLKKNCVLSNSISQTTITSHYALDHSLSKAITNWLD
ncbi:16918_t:CDS:2 [Dentiscutata heterogama]|uniref:16918_t:CDS:1 n=2 Tax=Dentiscutata heterogama TaxID=1316150 RepID=A0ACA9KC26_9GLOM|nr:16917_t:CDS:2 [Dentiscutata heterogama]CAG8463593.1 16918_t:CDS:2 [Dentiscutata heterogama]